MDNKFWYILAALLGGVVTFLVVWSLDSIFPTQSPVRTALPAAITVVTLMGGLLFFLNKDKE